MGHQQPDRFIRPQEIKIITGMSRTSIWRLEKAGEFPARRRISSAAVGWLLSEVIDWMNNLQKANKKGSPKEAA